jgi:hypothetical protein
MGTIVFLVVGGHADDAIHRRSVDGQRHSMADDIETMSINLHSRLVSDQDE